MWHCRLSREAEVPELDGGPGVHEYVGGFDIPMDHPAAMDVVESADELPKNVEARFVIYCPIRLSEPFT